MYTRRLLAIDPSLTCSGWALFSIETGTLTSVGKIRSLPPTFPLADRLRDLQEKILKTITNISLGINDVLICEAQTTMRDPKAAFKVEQVRGIFETIARGYSITVPGRINPRSVHHEVMGLNGKQLPRNEIKTMAVQVVSTLFTSALSNMGFDTDTKSLARHQDIVDAILIGNLALSWIKSAQIAGHSLEAFFDSRERRRVNSFRKFANL